MITSESVKEIKEKVSIAEVASRYLSLKKRGRNYFALCPFHSEKTPSFSVRDDAGFYHCFGCGASGDIFSLVMKLEGISYPEAVEKLARENGITVKYTKSRADRLQLKMLYAANSAALSFYRTQLERHWVRVFSYLQSRGINKECVEHFELGYAPFAKEASLISFLRENSDNYSNLLSPLKQLGLIRDVPQGVVDLFANRIVFPIHLPHGGEVIGFGGRTLSTERNGVESYNPKYINTPESPIYKKGSIFFNWHRAQREIAKIKEVFIVEGYFDVLGMYMMGFLNCVATCGTALTEEHAKFLSQRLSRIKGKAVLLFDGDRAGKQAAAKAAEQLFKWKVDGEVLVLPEGEDPHSLYKKWGASQNWLKRCRKQSFLEAYLDNILAEEGKQIRELSPVKKSAVLDQLIRFVLTVDDLLLQSEGIKEITSLLRLPLSIVQERVKKVSRRKIPAKAGEDRADKGSKAGQKRGKIPLRDAQFLICVLIIGPSAAANALKNPELCTFCNGEVLTFLEEFSKAPLNSEEVEYFVKAKEFLERNFPSFLPHLKEAFNMKKDPEVSVEKLYKECLSSYSKLQRLTIVEKLQQEALLAPPEEKARIFQEIIRLEREGRETVPL